MKKKVFKKLLEDYKQFNDNVSSLYNVGIDLSEGMYPTANFTYDLFQLFLQQKYTDFGVDWINWFIFENDFGKKGLEAFDKEKLICQDVKGLFKYIKQYKK